MKKRLLSILLATFIVLTVLPASVLTVFAADEQIVIESIELEAVKPTEGALPAMPTIKSVNGDEALADKVSFIENKLYWAEVPGLDPDEWNGNWTKQTGAYEMGKFYSLHVAFETGHSMDTYCRVKVYDENGELFSNESIKSADSNHLGGDVMIGQLTEDGYFGTKVGAIEITLNQELTPVTGEAPFDDGSAFTIAKVNGVEGVTDHGLSVYIENWRFSDTFGTSYYFPYEKAFFEGGYYYQLRMYIFRYGNFFEDVVEVTVKTPTQTYTIPHVVAAGAQEIYFNINLAEKTEGEPLKLFGEGTIEVSGYELGAKVGDIVPTINCEGVTLGEYVMGSDSVSGALPMDAVIENDDTYCIYLNLHPEDGYTTVDFDLLYEHLTWNGLNLFVLDYDVKDGKEYVQLVLVLPRLGDGLTPITAPTLTLENYEPGVKTDDVTVSVTSDMLSVDSLDFTGWLDDGDGVIEKCEQFDMEVVYCFDHTKYSTEGISKDMFLLDGKEPDFVSVVDNDEIYIVYRLPAFHDQITVQYDDDHHWKTCSCGAIFDEGEHLDSDSDLECDECGYEVGEPIYIYSGFDMILEGYKIGNPVKAGGDGTYVRTPDGAHYYVVYHEIRKYDPASTTWVTCSESEVFEAGAKYMVSVEIRPEKGYVLMPSNVAGDIYDVTLNGLAGFKETLGYFEYDFYLPILVENGIACPEGEIGLDGFLRGNSAGEVSLELPPEYSVDGYGMGYILYDESSETALDPADVLDDSTYVLICLITLPDNYDLNTLSKDTLTLFGTKPFQIIHAPTPWNNTIELYYYLPIAPNASDTEIENIEVELNNFKPGASTEDVSFAVKNGVGFVVEAGRFIYNDGSYEVFAGSIEEGEKYYYMLSIYAEEGYTISSMKKENISLNGKTPTEFFYEDGMFLIAVFELTATNASIPGTPGTPGTDPGSKPDTPENGEASAPTFLAILALVGGGSALVVIAVLGVGITAIVIAGIAVGIVFAVKGAKKKKKLNAIAEQNEAGENPEEPETPEAEENPEADESDTINDNQE